MIMNVLLNDETNESILFTLIACGGFLGMACCLQMRNDRSKPIVETIYGKIMGRWSKRTAVFEGIPYAKPPIEQLRWKPPEDLIPWKGVKKALFPKPFAWEEGLCLPRILEVIADGYGFNTFYRGIIKLFLPLFPKSKKDEDCLYLNIRTNNLNSDSKAPVMVWIHGGNFVDGGSTDPMTTATGRVMEKGVVIVTISYRLGVFGFLAHPDFLQESKGGVCGNYGLLDQIAALKWVQKNIINFGGDPDNITIFGYSAGGESVAHLMGSPLAKGLFHKAILQSPSCSCPMLHLFHPFMSYPKALDVGSKFAEKLGLSAQDDNRDRLRKTPAQHLMKVVHEGKFNDIFLPAIDGHVIPMSPLQFFMDGDQAKVPFLIGSNQDDGSVLYPYFLVPMVEYFKCDNPIGNETASYFLPIGENFPADDREKLMAIYPGLNTRDGKAESDFMTDHTFGSTAIFYASCAKRNVEQDVFMYRFEWTPSSSSQTLGAFHGSELFFIFGNPSPVLFPFGFTQKELELSNTMITYWTQFARSGNPNFPGLPEWEKFDPDDPRLLTFGTSNVGMDNLSSDLREKYEIMNRLKERRIRMAEKLPAALPYTK
mmetsp:Transcript_32008/g.41040  ORF Transcript_32008/g.41040 Transcript_32008/m.41040 type:complete len:596 (-) Transcript_32008:225-2012(-)